MTSQVGPGACLPSDAAFAERRLARDLAAAGRSAASASAAEFVALTLAPVEDTRRSAWSVYRAGELDGFQDSKARWCSFFLWDEDGCISLKIMRNHGEEEMKCDYNIQYLPKLNMN